MTVKTFDGYPKIYSFASILEDKAKDQLLEAGSLPFIWPHASGMPDMHWGMGCPIGLVLPTLGAIVPGAVGVDIGCGMIAAQTTLSWDQVRNLDLRKLRLEVEKVIPMSKGNYNTSFFDEHTETRIRSLEEKDGVEQADEITGTGIGNWRKQVGTMGGGNHFFEFCRDREDRVWLFVHSGSRGVGNRLAVKHIKIAQHLCKKWWIELPNPDLAYLVQGTPEFTAYIRDLHWAQHFALLNREEMIHRARVVLQQWYGSEVKFGEIIRCHHNYTEQMPPELILQFRKPAKETPRSERVHGNVWLTRKGAIDASLGTKGLLPGSMGGKSYITVGKGDKLGLWSAPHGAGRVYGRRQANSLFSVEQLKESMKGVEWSEEIADQLRDEIPYAYKDLNTVLADSSALIRVENTLTAFINIKGA